jgi:hypothetical protein
MPMKPVLSQDSNPPMRSYSQLTAADYIDQMEPLIRESLTGPQLVEIGRLLDKALPKPSPKIVDLRFSINLVLTRYFIVLLVGQDRRKQPRARNVSPLTRLGNLVAAVFLLLSLNVTLSLALLLGVYLVKSALGINLLPGHFWSNIRAN